MNEDVVADVVGSSSRAGMAWSKSVAVAVASVLAVMLLVVVAGME